MSHVREKEKLRVVVREAERKESQRVGERKGTEIRKKREMNLGH